MFLKHSCALPGAQYGKEDQQQEDSRTGKGDSYQMAKGSLEWQSWIEMLLLKHPEEKVRDGFYKLLLTAASSCTEGHVCTGSEKQANNVKLSASVVAEQMNSDNTVRNVGRGLVEQLGVRLLQEVEAAAINWTGCTLHAALAANGQDKVREKQQIHQFLLLLSELVVRKGWLSCDLVRKIGESLLLLVIGNAAQQPALAKVLAEAWVKMLGCNQTGSVLRDLLHKAAFVSDDALSLTRWTWLVEWLHKCTATSDHVLSKASKSAPLPGAANAYYTLYVLRLRLLARVKGARECCDFETEYCMSRLNTAAAQGQERWEPKWEANRQRLMSLEVEGAGHSDANGTYFYAGYLLHQNRAVYTHSVGSTVYLLMAASQSPHVLNAITRVRQQWVLAECTYGVSWGAERRGGLHVLHDAALLSSAFASGDMRAIQDLWYTSCTPDVHLVYTSL